MNDVHLRRGLIAVLVLGGCLLGPAPASAHGPVPAAVGILTEDETGPTALQLSEGIAVRFDDGTWRWVCPSLWGGPDTPIVGGSDSHGIFVAGIDDLHLVAHTTAEVTALETPDIAATRARAMVRDADDPDAVWALVNDPAEDVATALWRLGGASPERVAGLADNWYGLVADDQGRLVFVRPTQAGELRMGLMPVDDPAALAEVTITGPAIGSPSVRSDGTDTYLAMRVGLDQELWTLADDGTATFLIRAQAASVHGPVRRADGLLTVVSDGVLTRVDPATTETEVIDDSQLYTCLQARRGAEPGVGVVCAWGEMFEFDDTGIGARLFGLDELQPWLPGGLDEETAATCEADWIDFAVDAGLIDPPPMDELDTVEAVEADDAVDTVEPAPDAADVAERTDTASDVDLVEETDTGAPPDEASADEGCGCRAVGGGGHRVPWTAALVALVALVGLRTTRRRWRGRA